MAEQCKYQGVIDEAMPKLTGYFDAVYQAAGACFDEAAKINRRANNDPLLAASLPLSPAEIIDYTMQSQAIADRVREGEVNLKAPCDRAKCGAGCLKLATIKSLLDSMTDK